MDNTFLDKWKWAAASAIFAYSAFLSIFLGHSPVLASLLLVVSTTLFITAVKGSFRSFWRDLIGTKTPNPVPISTFYIVPPSLKIA